MRPGTLVEINTAVSSPSSPMLHFPGPVTTHTPKRQKTSQDDCFLFGHSVKKEGICGNFKIECAVKPVWTAEPLDRSQKGGFTIGEKNRTPASLAVVCGAGRLILEPSAPGAWSAAGWSRRLRPGLRRDERPPAAVTSSTTTPGTAARPGVKASERGTGHARAGRALQASRAGWKLAPNSLPPFSRETRSEFPFPSRPAGRRILSSAAFHSAGFPCLRVAARQGHCYLQPRHFVTATASPQHC